MTHPYILSIDQSTQGTKAMLLDEYGSFLLRRDVPHRQIISDSGWVLKEVIPSQAKESIFFNGYLDSPANRSLRS